MAENQLFNIPTAAAEPSLAAPVSPAVAPPAAVPTPVAPAPSNLVGVITTQQSAITFAGAPAAVTLVWKVIGAAAPSLASSKLLPIVLSIAVGMLIYWQSAPVQGTRREKITGFAFALINSFAIAAAALGIGG